MCSCCCRKGGADVEVASDDEKGRMLAKDNDQHNAVEDQVMTTKFLWNMHTTSIKSGLLGWKTFIWMGMSWGCPLFHKISTEHFTVTKHHLATLVVPTFYLPDFPCICQQFFCHWHSFSPLKGPFCSIVFISICVFIVHPYRVSEKWAEKNKKIERQTDRASSLRPHKF